MPALAFVISILSRATSRIYIRIPFILIPLLQMLFWIKEIWPPFKNVLDLPPLLFVQTILAMRFISDFDTKLIGGHACEYLNSLLIHVNAAPAHRQDKYGLAECHWQTIIAMARNWLASAEIPSSFWFFAVKCAAEVCNYFPLKLSYGSWTTPLELAHQVKPDLCALFRLFSVVAVHCERDGDKTLGKFDSQSNAILQSFKWYSCFIY